jgi:hypothetical protein
MELQLVMFWLWLAFASMHGIYDGELYEVRDFRKRFQTNPHIWATILRIIAATGFIFAYTGFSWEFLIDALGYALCFSFWHNGMYYERRARIKTMDEGYHFFSTSTTSTAILEFGAVNRTVQHVFGIGLVFWNF